MGGAFTIGVLAGAICGIAIGSFIGSDFADARWRTETVARGLALYCPENGQWAWVGECGE